VKASNKGSVTKYRNQTSAHRDGADDEGKTIAVALMADFRVDGDLLGDAQQSDFFRLLLPERPLEPALDSLHWQLLFILDRRT
jgi:hypothetical protein